MFMNINDVTHAIMFGDFTNDQLNAIAQAVKYRRSRITSDVKRGLCIGDKVRFTGRSGQFVIGKVTKVNRKFIIVQENRGGYLPMNWRVPANMLETDFE
jgi:uncharacterized protein (DUF4213/DUF364 family)